MQISQNHFDRSFKNSNLYNNMDLKIKYLEQRLNQSQRANQTQKSELEQSLLQSSTFQNTCQNSLANSVSGSRQSIRLSRALEPPAIPPLPPAPHARLLHGALELHVREAAVPGPGKPRGLTAGVHKREARKHSEFTEPGHETFRVQLQRKDHARLRVSAVGVRPGPAPVLHRGEHPNLPDRCELQFSDTDAADRAAQPEPRGRRLRAARERAERGSGVAGGVRPDIHEGGSGRRGELALAFNRGCQRAAAGGGRCQRSHCLRGSRG